MNGMNDFHCSIESKLTKRNDRNTERPETDDKLTSNSDRMTITKSNIFQPSRK